VTDDQGRYVSGLRPEDFIIEEDGVRQDIVHFTPSRDLPVSVGIVLDTSASMERKILTATRAVDRFIRNIHDEDEIFYMTFDERVARTSPTTGKSWPKRSSKPNLDRARRSTTG
jgi:VWFA-related protein